MLTIREIPLVADEERERAWRLEQKLAIDRLLEIWSEPRPIHSKNFHGLVGGPEHVIRNLKYGIEKE